MGRRWEFKRHSKYRGRHEWEDPEHPLWELFIGAIGHEYSQEDWEDYKRVHGGMDLDPRWKNV